ncbi:hypothetical protein JXA85_03545 [Candidatus Woesearchaeota archaeon]|nr:hypothetical protein [Candidatus Woesearchaeota archaeon]
MDKIITGVDKLLNLVNEKGEISFTRAATELKVSRKRIEEWCAILEEKGLLVTVPTLREAYILSIDHHADKSGFLKSLKRQIRCLGADVMMTDEEHIKRKEQELNQKAMLLEKQEKALEKNKMMLTEEKLKIQSKLNEQKLLENRNAKKQKDILLQERQIEANRISNQDEKERLQAEQKRISSEEQRLLNVLNDFSVQKEELLKTEQRMNELMQKAERRIKTLEREKDILLKENERLRTDISLLKERMRKESDYLQTRVIEPIKAEEAA